MFPDALDIIPDVFSHFLSCLNEIPKLLLDFIKARLAIFYDLFGSIASSLAKVIV